MRKIAFVIHSLELGGAERVISDLANNFSEENFTVKIILFSNAKKHYDISESIEIISIEKLSKKNHYCVFNLAQIRRVFLLRKILIDNEINCVISFTTIVNIYSILSVMNLDINLIISERTDPKIHKLDFLIRILRKFMYKFSDFLVVQNKIQLAYFLNYIDRKKVLIIPNPVNSIKESYEFDNSVNLVSVGRLVKSKNHIELIKIFKDSNVNCMLYIIGDGDQRANIENYIENNNLSKKVKLLGVKKNIYEILNPNWIYISASLYEGFPNSLIEAMNAGLNCIVYDCPSGMGEIIDDKLNGYLIPLNNNNIFRYYKRGFQ